MATPGWLSRGSTAAVRRQAPLQFPCTLSVSLSLSLSLSPSSPCFSSFSFCLYFYSICECLSLFLSPFLSPSLFPRPSLVSFSVLLFPLLPSLHTPAPSLPICITHTHTHTHTHTI